MSEERREKKEKEDKEEEGRMGRRRQRREEEEANTAPMPLCQFMWSMGREMSLLLTTSLKLSPLQFFSFSLHSDFSGSQAGGIKRERTARKRPRKALQGHGTRSSGIPLSGLSPSSMTFKGNACLISKSQPRADAGQLCKAHPSSESLPTASTFKGRAAFHLQLIVRPKARPAGAAATEPTWLAVVHDKNSI